MARTTNKTAKSEQAVSIASIQAELARANRVAVSAEQTWFVAEFWRTHKRVGKVTSIETGWVANPQQNRSAQREDFRTFITEHSADIGILWSPEDQRTDTNKRLAKYGTDEELGQDAIALMGADITEFVTKSPFETTIESIEIDAIAPVGISSKGTDLSKLGILDGRYEKNGNWAWASIGICITLKAEEQEIYVSLTSTLVSGQLKKPAHIGDGGWTQTAWNATIRKELESAGIIKAEVK